jgi:MFS family permease
VPLLLGSMAWYTARWGSLFVVTYLLARETGSPVLVQVAGALLFLPLLAGGFLGGLLTQRRDSKRLVTGSLAALCLVVAVMGAVAALGSVPLWTLFPFILLVGVGQLVNMTVQRDLLFAVVGPRHVRHALVVDAVQTSTSMALGNVTAGALVEVGGPTGAFGGLLLLHLAGLLCLQRIQRPVAAAPVVGLGTSDQWRATMRVLRRSPALRLALAITISMNSCVYGYLSLVPLLVRRFDPSPMTASLLAAGDGLGQVCAGLVLMTLGVRHPGRLLAGGAVVTSIGILVLSQATGPTQAFVALVLAGIGTSGYAATQTVVALRDAAPEEQAAVLGLISTAIGAMPVGMLSIGVLAWVLPTETALALTAAIGLTLVLGCAFVGRATLRAS